ncbi:hypothetical protein RCL1_002996 [Eukaryota sp. TZLM3-RCL]
MSTPLSLDDLTFSQNSQSPHNSFVDDANSLLNKLDSAIKLSATLNSDDASFELSRIRGELKARLHVLLLRVSESNKVLSQKLDEERISRTSLEARLSNLEAKFVQTPVFVSQVEDVQSNVDTLSNSLSDCFSMVKKLQVDINKINEWKDNAVGAIQACSDGITKVVTSLRSASSDHNQSISKVSSQIETIISNVNRISSRIENLETQLSQVSDGNLEKFSLLQRDLNSISQEYKLLSSSVHEVRNHVSSSVEDNFTTLSHTLSQLQASFEDIQGKVSSLEAVASTADSASKTALYNLQLIGEKVKETVDDASALLRSRDVFSRSSPMRVPHEEEEYEDVSKFLSALH